MLGLDGDEVPVGDPLQGFLVPELEEVVARALDTVSSGGDRFPVGSSVELNLPRLVPGGRPVTVSLNQGAETLPVNANGTFAFQTLFATGDTYEVVVDGSPGGQIGIFFSRGERG